MNDKFGEKLRELRRSRDLTQDRAAEVFGVTPQSVSKWETGAAYPDITLLPAIANYYGVSSDELLGIDAAKAKQKVKEYTDEIESLMLTWKHEEILETARRRLSEFPGSHELMFLLAQCLCQFVRDKSEPIALCERILEESKDTQMREKTTALLYATLNNTDLPEDAERARAVAETLPSFKYSREYQLAHDMNPRDAKQTSEMRKFIIELSRTLAETIFINAGGRRLDRYEPSALDIPESIRQTDCAISILQTIFGENLLHMAFAAAEYCSVISEWYCVLGDNENALSYLEKYTKYAQEYDAYRDGEVYTSPVVSGIESEGHTWSDSGMNCVRYTLSKKEWDSIRTHPRFAALAAE